MAGRYKDKDYQKKYHLAHKEEENKRDRAYNRDKTKEYKSNIFNILGMKCVWCGFDDIRALQIDHVKGGGIKERKYESSRGYYKNILMKVLQGSKDYQILCANCNQIKRIENKEMQVGKE